MQPMPISVHVAERGQRLLTLADVAELVPPPSSALTYLPLVDSRARMDFPLLAGVDPEGNTCFNQPQGRWLDEELKALADTRTGPERSLARALRLLVAEQLSRPHRYLWFIGD